MHYQHPPDLKKIADKAMEQYGFRPEFPEPVLREVNNIQEDISPEIKRNARDLRSILWVSIDNHDTMDIDQIQFCERKPGNKILVKIAIADVDYRVKKGSATDRHAATHGTSIYTGIVTYPMLPLRLSEDISSLHPHRDRMAMIIEYTVLPDGSIQPGDIYPAIVQNKAKLVYEIIGEWLESGGDFPYEHLEIPDLSTQILLQHEAAQRMKEERTRQGFLDLQTIEASPVMEEGMVHGLVVQQESPAHSLIEECMISANRTLVACLRRASFPMVQRIVRTPRNWDGIVEEAAARHTRLPADPDVQALAAFLLDQKRKDPETFPDLSLTVVKLMGPGEYVALAPGDDSVGHFALAVTDYTHGTAPNRRYADIIIQRLIKAAIHKRSPPYEDDELTRIATNLSASEKAAKKVERFMRKAAGAVLLMDRIGETFNGLVTGASEKGTYARIIDPPVEGRIVRNEGRVKVGQRVNVRLLKTDPENGFIDFEKI